MRRFFFRYYIALFILPAVIEATTAQDCCGVFVKDAQKAINNLDWQKAFEEYTNGKGCQDANRCPELASIYDKIQSLKKQEEKEYKTWNTLQYSEDADKMQREYVDICKICKNKTDARQRIEFLRKQEQQQDDQAFDAALWQKALNAVTHLPVQEYIDHCRICDKKAAAEERLKEWQKKEIQAKADKDAARWNGIKLSDDPFTIAAFIHDCITPCAYKEKAEMLLREIIETRSRPDMVLVTGGNYKMGDLFKDNKEEEKVHEVEVNTFFMATREVTFQQYIAFCFDTHRPVPDDHQWGKGNQPVINIDWFDAVEYCNWRSDKDGFQRVYTIDSLSEDANNNVPGNDKKWLVTPDWSANGYRLPTEAEWEYAARSGGKKFRFGNDNNDPDPAQINFDPENGSKRKRPVPTGSLGAPNALGLHDMSGNVFEWCWDWFNSEYYRESVKNAPKGPKNGMTRVARGGCYFSFQMQCRNTFRFHWKPSAKFHYVGFRVVRNR
jgi:formylglycine-generating enzyme required for sulfatase activity